MATSLHLVGDPAADALLSDEPMALLVGMLLDQQIAMEVAFAGPRKLVERLGAVDAPSLAACDPDRFAEAFSATPAVHRFPGSMAKRVQALATAIVDDYGGDAARLWIDGEPDGRELLARLKRLPGFGDQKARIFVALLGKQYGVTPPGWREAAGDYGGEGTRMSIADVVDADSLDEVRAFKKARKAAAAKAAP